MPDKPFVINDRRKFTSEGEVRPGVELDRQPREDAPRKVTATGIPIVPGAETPAVPQDLHPGPQAVPSNNVTEMPSRGPEASVPQPGEDAPPPPPTPEQIAAASRAYEATADRLDTAIRAANPGAERLPEMSFERFVQSLYMQAVFQLGGATEPGQQPRVDPLGARQTIDMLAIFATKTAGNLTPDEQNLLDSALFESRMAFLEVTQMLAQQAAARQTGPLPPPPGGGPSIVR